MKLIKNFDFINSNYKDLTNQLKERKTINQRKNIINYESFILEDPVTKIEFPTFDKPFFDRYKYTLDHILHCYKDGWIESERQVFYTSNECMTTLQFIFNKEKVQLNIFARSSNLKNLEQDIQFLNWYLDDKFKGVPRKILFFNSFPHIYLDRTTKVG